MTNSPGPPPSAPPPPPSSPGGHGGHGGQGAQQRPQQYGQQPVAAEQKKRSASTGQILAGILFVLVIIFIVENTEDVPIRFIAGPKVRLPVYLAILIAAVVGALIGALLRYRRRRHHQPETPKQQRR